MSLFASPIAIRIVDSVAVATVARAVAAVQDAIGAEIYFPAVAVAACTILFGIILIYILRLSTAAATSSNAGSSETFSKFFHQAEVGIGVIDSRGYFTLTNRSLQELTGYTGKQLSTIAFRSLFADRSDHVEQAKVAGMLDRFGESHQVFLRHRSGGLIRVRFLVLPAPESVSSDSEVLLIEAASVGGGGGTRSDADENLHEAKENFFDSLNHDLKTPLTVILGNASLLAQEKKYSSELVDAILLSGKRLLNELNGLLLLADSRPEGNVSARSSDLKSIVTEIVADYRGQLERRTIAIDVAELERTFSTVDQLTFHRLISLVIDYAIQRMSNGKLSVASSVENGVCRLMFTIAGKGAAASSGSDSNVDDPVLLIASRLVERVDGALHLRDHNENETAIEITVPAISGGTAGDGRVVRAA